MQHEILYKPAYTLVEMKLDAGESIEAEAGAMVYMSPGIDIATKTKGGVMGALSRSLLGGKSFLYQFIYCNIRRCCRACSAVPRRYNPPQS